jgi:hypothetical protein
VKKWIFLEAGEAKTTVDSHHAQVCSKNIFFLKKESNLLVITNKPLDIPFNKTIYSDWW